MITQNETDWVLKMAEDELDHLERDSELDDDCMKDYLYSKKTLEKVREHLTAVPKTPPSDLLETKMKYDFKTEISDDKIYQTLSVTRHAITTEIMMWVYDAREKSARQALISLGWTPPVEHLATEGEIKP